MLSLVILLTSTYYPSGLTSSVTTVNIASSGSILNSVSTSSSSTPTPGPNPTGSTSIISPLHVEGNLIKDSAGNTVQFRGVNKVEMADDPDGIWMSSTVWSDGNVKAELDAMKSLGVNFVRAIQSVDNWKYNLGPDSQSAISNKDAVKRLLTFAAERGIYVCISGYRVTNYWNGGGQDPLPYPPYQTSKGASSVITSSQDFVNYWASVASELKDYKNVVFELWNEPYGDATAKASWFSVVQKTISAIRSTGAQNLIVVQWDMAAFVNLNFPPGEGGIDSSLSWVFQGNLNDPSGNLVYSTHLYRTYNHVHYSQPTTYQAYTFSDVDKALRYMKYYEVAEKYPLLIGEIGVNLAYTGTELSRDLEFFDNALTIFDQKGISYACWWWRSFGQFGMYSDSFNLNVVGDLYKTHLTR